MIKTNELVVIYFVTVILIMSFVMTILKLL